MIRDLLFGLGMVAVIEGLVLSLAPLRFERILLALHALGPERTRLLGLVAIALGTVLVAVARA
ncbi:MAG: DUF2065 family protein [Paracoccaceae bacterium]